MEGHRSRVDSHRRCGGDRGIGMSFLRTGRSDGPIPKRFTTTRWTTQNQSIDTILGQYQDDLAMPYFRRAVQANKIGDFAMGKELTGQGIAYLEKAMTFYRTAIRLGPDEPHGYDMLARDLVRLEQIPEAIDSRQNMDLHRTSLGTREERSAGRLEGMLGTLYLRNHQYPEAVAALKRSLAEHPDPDVEKTLAKAEKLAARPQVEPPDPAAGGRFTGRSEASGTRDARWDKSRRARS